MLRHHLCRASWASNTLSVKHIPQTSAQRTLRRVTCCSTAGMFAGPGADALRGRSCAALGVCSITTPKVTSEEMPELLKALPAWTLVDAAHNNALVRKFTAKGFTQAMRFLNELAELAEVEGHHPDFHLTNYRDVEVRLTTHKVKGLTLYDFILAAKVDQINVDYSPKWLEKQSVPSKP
mmetsp:Transcript_13066/g.23048  ORF Transcript_13066/g.23048 Transcript_13066/m.23048 type:complete len:179 (-) Transcript_13066:745-1281(-)